MNVHPIAYELNGIRIAANVYTPADYDPLKKYPAVTVAHPNGGRGYTLNAPKSEKRVKAVATLSMFTSGRVHREGYMSLQVNYHPPIEVDAS